MEHILIVEDDLRLSNLIKGFLEKNGFKVTAIDDGAIVLDYLNHHRPDLIILDVSLPNVDGLTLCKSIKVNSDVPVLFLTARDDDRDQILGLELGADDYIIKPIEPNVLLARIRMIQRRLSGKHAAKSKAIETDLVVIDPIERSLSINGQGVPLTSYEFDLLWLLANNQGVTVKRDDIHNLVIGRDFDGLDRNVDVRISRLRKKLKNVKGYTINVETVWGKGYTIRSLDKKSTSAN